MKQRDKIITIVVVVVFVAFFAYRYATAPQPEPQDMVHVGGEAMLREITVENFYDAPGITRHVTYTVFIDTDGVIQDVTSKDLNQASHQTKMDEFVGKLVPMIQGQKLEDLKEVDMVGTSSLTTKSFNAALPEIRLQAGIESVM